MTDTLLMRDDLQDTGSAPSHGSYYRSPDVISHPQVTDPQTYFADNYSSNPNQPVQLGSQINPIYVRAKNIGTSTLPQWYVHVYRARSSLFVNTNEWSGNPLQTISGTSYVTMNPASPNSIVVGNDYFVLSGLSSDLFCLIGIASSTTTPTIPPPFSSYSNYVDWVKQNPNVCGNNLTVVRDYPDRQYERTDSFDNPEDHEVGALFWTKVIGNPPAGLTFGVQCDPLNINAHENVDHSKDLTTSAVVPANFPSTNYMTWGSLPTGTSQWPSGLTIRTEYHVTRDPGDEIAAPYAQSWEQLPIKPIDMPGLPEGGYLILVGTCTTEFIG
jgi:hypothetical protein